MASEQKLPQESEAQRIGHRADKCFQANRPDGWRVKSLEGTDDAGLDFQVQIVDGEQYTRIFRLQLKGTESPTLNATGDFYSISLERSTLNYYARVTEPILLVLCDLSVDRITKNCPSFYVWIHDELKRHRESGKSSSGSESLVVRVPVSNRVVEELDLRPELDSKLRLHKAAAALEAMVEDKLPSSVPDERLNLIENLATGFAMYDSSLLRAVTSPATSPWPEAPKDSFAGKLNEIDRLLSIGVTVKTGALLDALAVDLSSATSHEQAEYWYCKGRLSSWLAEGSQAEQFHEKSCSLAPTLSRYIVAWAEAYLAVFFEPDGSNEFSAVKARLTSDEPEVKTMLARLLAAEGDETGAVAVLATLERKQALSTRCVIASMFGRHEEVFALCNEGLAQEELVPRHEQLFHLLRARAKFTLALSEEVLNAGNYVIASWSGPSTLDGAMLRSAWDDIVATVELMRKAGWPTNVDYIADIWGSTALMLGRPKETYELAKEAAAARPYLEDLQRTLELLAVNVEDYKTALDANGRQPESSEQIFRRIGILHQSKSHAECLATMEANLASLPQEHQLYPVSVALGALSADRLLRTDRADNLANILLTKPEWEEHHATLKFFRATGANVFNREAALQALLLDYRRLGKPLGIALQLFHVLDASDANHAEICIEVVERIEDSQQLGLDGEFQLAQALVTLDQWGNLLALADRAISKHDHVGRFYAIRALALDKLGRTPDALKELRRLIAAGVSDRLAMDTYVNIVMRSGFVDEALELAERLLEGEAETSRRLECLQLLFNLLQAKDPGNRRAIEVAWAMGGLVDRNEELAEGQFLSMMLTVTSGPAAVLGPDRVVQFQKRLSDFFDKWPKSKILRRGSLPENASGSELLEALKGILGEPETPNPELVKLERQLNRGEIPVPFSWRPRLLLRNVRDVGQLWGLAKQSKLEAFQYHLTMVTGDWRERPFHERALGIPLLDLTALFVIQDLGLFDTLFAVFTKVAVSQALLLEIRERASPLSSSWAQQRYESLMRELNARFEHIEQPVNRIHGGEKGPKALLLSQDFISLLVDGRYFVYSDDAAYRLYVTQDGKDPKGFCTLDLLLRAEELGLLTLEQASEMVGRLCSWRVVMVILPRHFLGSLPGAVADAPTIGAAVDAIRRSETCTAILEGVWNVRKKYSDIASHVLPLLAVLISDHRNNIRTIAAIVGVWYLKAKLRTELKMLTGVERLAMLIAQTSTHEKVERPEVAKRLWSVYRLVTELEFGNRMDEVREREAVETIGRMCARLDLLLEKTGSKTPHRNATRRGLEPGTSDMERFDSAYMQHVTDAARESSS